MSAYSIEIYLMIGFILSLIFYAVASNSKELPVMMPIGPSFISFIIVHTLLYPFFILDALVKAKSDD